MKSRILLANYYLPGQLERSMEEFVEYYNNCRSHERSRERAQANGAGEVSSKLEGEIHEVISRTATAPRAPQQNDNELAASNIGSLVQRVSGTSVHEIDRLIADLQIVSDMVQQEASRE